MATISPIYAATREFATDPTDAMASTPFYGTVQKALRVERSIVDTNGFGRITMTWGELELINADGEYDDFIENYAIDGRRIVVKIGKLGKSYNTFVTVYDGTASDWHVAEDVLRVTLRDNGYLLEKPLQPNSYTGAGGKNGSEDLAGKTKPKTFGQASNVTAQIVDPAYLTYQVHDGPINAITAVYDMGAALTPTSDYASYEAMWAARASVAPGQFSTSLAEGYFLLGGSPFGAVTADVQGDKTEGTYVNQTHSIVRRIVALAGILDPYGLVTASFTTVGSTQPAIVSYFAPSDSGIQVADAVADLMGGIGGWGGFRRDGLFEVGIFALPSGTPKNNYTDVDILEISREALPDGVWPPPYRYRVAYDRNWTVQERSNLASIAESRVAYLAEPYRVSISA